MRKVETNNNILVPIDFSEVANNALGHAVKIAELYNNEITLLHIIDDGFLGGLFTSESKDNLIKEAVNIKLDRIIDDIHKTKSIKVNKIIKEGSIAKTIADVAEEGNFDSVIMGSNGASGIEQIIGSNASKVIKYSTVPVVVVKEKPIAGGYKKIVLPIDLTLESRQKVSWAIHIAKKFNSVIHVIFENEDDEFTRKRIFAYVNNVQTVLEKNNVTYEVRKLDEEKYPDNFAKETLHYAEEIDADLIIIMTQQEVGFTELVVGSYAQQIVNQSEKIPIMCINPTELGLAFEGVIGS